MYQPAHLTIRMGMHGTSLVVIIPVFHYFIYVIQQQRLGYEGR